jgi:hypothetical protein
MRGKGLIAQKSSTLQAIGIKFRSKIIDNFELPTKPAITPPCSAKLTAQPKKFNQHIVYKQYFIKLKNRQCKKTPYLSRSYGYYYPSYPQSYPQILWVNRNTLLITRD